MVLLAIMLSNQFVHYLHSAAAGTITMHTVMMVMALQVPLLLGYLLPLGLYLGILLVLGRWYADNEMTVLSACGMSPWRLWGMVGILSIVLMVVESYLIFWMEPKTQWYRIQLLNEAAASLAVDKVPVGHFQLIDRDQRIIVYAGKKAKHNRLKYIFLARPHFSPDNTLQTWEVVTAQTLEENEKSDYQGDFLVLNKGYRYSGDPRTSNYQVIQFQEFGITTSPRSTETRPKDKVKFMSTMELWDHYADPQAASELQWRMAMPLSLLLLALLAVPLSYLHPRQGPFGKLFPALLIYLIYMDLVFIGHSWVFDGKLNATWGLWWVHLLMGLLAVGLMYYQVTWHRRWALT